MTKQEIGYIMEEKNLLISQALYFDTVQPLDNQTRFYYPLYKRDFLGQGKYRVGSRVGQVTVLDIDAKELVLHPLFYAGNSVPFAESTILQQYYPQFFLHREGEVFFLHGAVLKDDVKRYKRITDPESFPSARAAAEYLVWLTDVEIETEEMKRWEDVET